MHKVKTISSYFIVIERKNIKTFFTVLRKKIIFNNLIYVITLYDFTVFFFVMIEAFPNNYIQYFQAS